jgi:hypothetical protein
MRVAIRPVLATATVAAAATAMAVAAAPRVAAADAPVDAPWVKPAAAPRAIADAIASADPKAPAGAGRLVARLEKGDPAKDGAAIRDALVKGGFTVLDDRSEPGLFVVTLEAKAGQRVRVALDAYSGSITLVARPAKTTPPGACVAIPSVDHPVYVNSSGVDQEGELRHGQTFWGFATRRLTDVDGDGRDDAFVPVAKKHACPEQVAWRIYAVRGGCGHDLGVVGPGSLDHAAAITVPLDASGFRPLVVVAESTAHGKRGIPEHTTITRRFEVRRGAYVQVDTKQRTGVCHHCATWHCNSP